MKKLFRILIFFHAWIFLNFLINMTPALFAQPIVTTSHAEKFPEFIENSQPLYFTENNSERKMLLVQADIGKQIPEKMNEIKSLIPEYQKAGKGMEKIQKLLVEF